MSVYLRSCAYTHGGVEGGRGREGERVGASQRERERDGTRHSPGLTSIHICIERARITELDIRIRRQERKHVEASYRSQTSNITIVRHTATDITSVRHTGAQPLGAQPLTTTSHTTTSHTHTTETHTSDTDTTETGAEARGGVQQGGGRGRVRRHLLSERVRRHLLSERHRDTETEKERGGRVRRHARSCLGG